MKEKLCPIMSMPTSQVRRSILGRYLKEKDGEFSKLYDDFVPCQKERCMAWEKCHNPSLQREHPNDCADFCESKLHHDKTGIHLATFEDCKGYCKLIDVWGF